MCIKKRDPTVQITDPCLDVQACLDAGASSLYLELVDGHTHVTVSVSVTGTDEHAVDPAPLVTSPNTTAALAPAESQRCGWGVCGEGGDAAADVIEGGNSQRKQPNSSGAEYPRSIPKVFDRGVPVPWTPRVMSNECAGNPSNAVKQTEQRDTGPVMDSDCSEALSGHARVAAVGVVGAEGEGGPRRPPPALGSVKEEEDGRQNEAHQQSSLCVSSSRDSSSPSPSSARGGGGFGNGSGSNARARQQIVAFVSLSPDDMATQAWTCVCVSDVSE